MAGSAEGEVAIVTGAGINTGAVIAKTLAREGAAVVINYRSSATGAKATVADIEAGGGRAIAVPGDVTKPDDVTRLVARAVEAFGPVSILVNNANIRSYRPLMEITLEDWRKTLGAHARRQLPLHPGLRAAYAPARARHDREHRRRLRRTPAAPTAAMSRRRRPGLPA